MTLTNEEVESLKVILKLYHKSYRDITGKNLQTVEEVIEVIKSGEIDLQDCYYNYIDKCFPHGVLEQNESYFLDDHLFDLFSYENYLPGAAGKNIGSGCWIKVRTETGFEVHYAKPSNRKRRFNEEIESLQTQLEKHVSSALKDLQTVTKASDALNKAPETNKKTKALQDKLYEAHIRFGIELKPYEVRIQKSKSTTVYLLPYQYEIVDDIDQFSEAYLENVPGVTMKAIFTSDQNDIIFYLTSRGISKRTAEVMAQLGQSFFTVNMITAMDAYNEGFRNAVKIIEK